ncbi:glycosyltransferase [Planktomarina temperata]|nr:glycosyltransferase [Planktomarina temperata]
MLIIQLTPDTQIGGLQNFVFNQSEYLDIIKLSNKIIQWFAQTVVDRGQCLSLNAKSYKNIPSYFKFRRIITRALTENKDVVVHSHGITLLLALSVCDLLIFGRLRWIHTVHNMAQNEAGKARRLLWYFCFKFLKVRPVVISDLVEASFKYMYGDIKITKIPNKINTDKIEKITEEKRESIRRELLVSDRTKCVIVGRYDNQKNLLALFTLIINHKIFEKYEFIVITTGGHNGVEVEAIKKKFKLVRRVHFLKDRDDVPVVMSICDYYLSFSLFEGSPLTLMEAMSAGCMPIVTPTGGATETVGEYGAVAGGFCEDSFLSAFSQAINLRVTRDQLTSYSIKKFSYEKCGAPYVSLYRSKAT